MVLVLESAVDALLELRVLGVLAAGRWRGAPDNVARDSHAHCTAGHKEGLIRDA